jgi:hypothetical protein
MIQGKLYIEVLLDGGNKYDVVEQLYADEVPVKGDDIECMSGRTYTVIRREWVELGEGNYKLIHPILYVKVKK